MLSLYNLMTFRKRHTFKMRATHLLRRNVMNQVLNVPFLRLLNAFSHGETWSSRCRHIQPVTA